MKDAPSVSTPEGTTTIRVDENTSSSKKAEELKALLQSCKGQRHLIVIQNYPDPDAISTGLAHKIISRSFGIETDIVYAGIISHPENIALVKLLGIEMRRWEQGFDLSPYQGTIFVDNQGTTTGPIVEALQAQKIKELIVVDHHDPQNILKPAFIDIRKTGATATIYTDYLREKIISLEKGSQEHIMMATALMHGLKTDTCGFVRANAEDFRAASFLCNYVDSDLLMHISNQARSRQTMQIIEQALANRTIKESYSISGIGYVRCEDRDAIPQAADFLLTEENIHTAIVFGVITSNDQDESIVGSMRTSRLTIDPNEFLKEVFGKDPSGRYFGGGKKSAGGFEIPIGFLSGGNDKDFREMKWKLYKAQILQKILNKIGVKDNEKSKEDE
ncbi:MAG: bifunctional oligoribonuclease/PAP phosphatase NrnA [Candidatus Riflebacteria bacterium]|nr:bifunctional oligoribonuclease/PAP phosphatase NrnA [Candidatus Riflebacteria bacterium]